MCFECDLQMLAKSEIGWLRFSGIYNFLNVKFNCIRNNNKNFNGVFLVGHFKIRIRS